MQAVKNPVTDEIRPFPSGAILRSLEIIGKVVAPSTLLVALLFYFGWVRTNALYAAFGIDQSLLKFSTQDYLLRSIRITLGSVNIFLAIILVVLWACYALNRLRTKNPKLVLRLAGVICVLGIGLTLTSYVLPQDPNELHSATVWIPLLWTVGIGITSYGVYTYAQTKKGKDSNGDEVELLRMIPPWLCNWSLGLITALLIVGTFSTTANAAYVQGQDRAVALMINPTTLPGIVVYSKSDLMLEGSTITVEQLGDDPDAFQYRYSGLHLLVRSGNNYFLIPGTCASGAFHTIILPESDSIRIEAASGISNSSAGEPSEGPVSADSE